jgi:hypothetical protein
MTDYSIVEYKGKKYLVCVYVYKNEKKLFVIDEEKLHLLNTPKNWISSNGYIEKSGYYLHNLVTGRKERPGKGTKESIDHINRVLQDNRKENLRLISQSLQNKNQKKRGRKINLPEDCGIDEDEIPKCVWYQKDRNRFVIEIKANGEKIKKVGTGAKSVSLKEKLEQMKMVIEELKIEHPEYFGDTLIDEEYSDEAIELMKSYNEILKLSGYRFYKKCLVKIPEKKEYLARKKLENHEDRHLDRMENKMLVITNRRNDNLPPKHTGIEIDDIPKHTYYKKQSEKRGDSFVIDRKHPILLKHKLSDWKTTESLRESTISKFVQLLLKLIELNESKDSDIVKNDKVKHDIKKCDEIAKDKEKLKKLIEKAKKIYYDKKKPESDDSDSDKEPIKKKFIKKTLKKSKKVIESNSDDESEGEPIKKKSSKKTSKKSSKFLKSDSEDEEPVKKKFVKKTLIK